MVSEITFRGNKLHRNQYAIAKIMLAMKRLEEKGLMICGCNLTAAGEDFCAFCDEYTEWKIDEMDITLTLVTIASKQPIQERPSAGDVKAAALLIAAELDGSINDHI